MTNNTETRITTLLDSIEECAPLLDLGVGSVRTSAMPTSEPFRYLGNPPLQIKFAALVNDLFAALHSIGLARYTYEQIDIGYKGARKMVTVDIALPNKGWHLASRLELRKDLTSVIQRFQNGHLEAGQQDNFRSLINTWARRVRNDVKQRLVEQSPSKTEVAAA